MATKKTTTTTTASEEIVKPSMMKATFKIEFTDSILGTSPCNKDIYTEFIASKSPDATTLTEEVENLGAEAVAEKGMTIFPRKNGKPFLYDYQIRGYFKETCSAMSKIAGTLSSGLKAYKKEIDLRIFIKDRENYLIIPNDQEMGVIERPLRAQTMQGERVSLAKSETCPEGTTVTFTVKCMSTDMPLVREWLSYGAMHGTGQWRNSGHGRFVAYELVEGVFNRIPEFGD